jgi:hypothetical protein
MESCQHWGLAVCDNFDVDSGKDGRKMKRVLSLLALCGFVLVGCGPATTSSKKAETSPPKAVDTKPPQSDAPKLDTKTDPPKSEAPKTDASKKDDKPSDK